MKIAFIGAGSLGFTRELVRDLLTFPLLADAEIALMDIDRERLDFSLAAVRKIIGMGGYPATVSASLDRGPALEGADVVVTTILAGGIEVWRHDIEIPKRYGVDTCVGDTRGPSGIFRFLRTLPPMMEIVRDMERLCPKATLLNYTNPMAMLCGAIQRSSFIPTTGLCHSVQGTAQMLGWWAGATIEDRVEYTCAGINHQAWYLDFKVNGEDAYPAIRRAIVENEEIYRNELVRNEMFLALGKYVTESSGHNSEYNWWFRKRPDLIEKYCSPCEESGWNPGEYAYILREYQNKEDNWRVEAKKWIAAETPISLARGQEYAACIVNALAGGEPYAFNGNVPNSGLIDNLPQGACVEVPVLADRKGIHPIAVGPLPPECAILTQVSSCIEEMAITGSLRSDATMIYRAICHDPLTAAALSLAEIRQMVAEMFEKNREYLPQFESIVL
jgi:alpha-galactosidase